MSRKHPKSRTNLASKTPISRTHRIKDKGFRFLEEFKAFAIKGDIIDLAVGIIVGTAFNNLIQSLVKDMIMPVFGWVLAGSSFQDLYFVLGRESYPSLEAAQATGAPIILYGLFITRLIDFILISLTVFIVLRYFLRIKKQEENQK